MRTWIVKISAEDYVLCEKAAKKDGLSVNEWISFLLSKKVVHTSFGPIG